MTIIKGKKGHQMQGPLMQGHISREHISNLGEIGGTAMYSTGPYSNLPQQGRQGIYQAGLQSGGFAFIPAAVAAYAGLKSVQPFSKAKKALEDNVGEKGKKTLGYKIGHKIASIGSSLGFGASARIMGPIKIHRSGMTQPITYGGSKTRRVKHRKAHKHKKMSGGSKAGGRKHRSRKHK